MTFSAGSVWSGCPYLIVEVSGAHPTAIADFVGDTSFVAVLDTQTYRIVGTGARNEVGVRFFEKDVGTGKDLRTWQVVCTDSGDFEAEPVSNF